MIITIKKKPKLVIGFGGYPTVPNMIVAIIFRTRIILYEANAILGKANKFFLRYAYCIFTPYKNTLNIEKEYKNKVRHVSALVKQENIITKRKKNKKLTILVTGGSQGAKIFSKIVTEALKKVLIRTTDINIIQQAKREDITEIQKIYNELGITNKVESFFENIGRIYEKTDLAIARSGASTVAELTINKIPSIFIPLASKDNHQKQNIAHIINSGSGWMIEENKDSHQELTNKIIEIINTPTLLNKAIKNIEKIISNKKQSNISDILEKIIK